MEFEEEATIKTATPPSGSKAVLSNALAEVTCVALIAAGLLLHFSRYSNCSGNAVHSGGWDWMCQKDTFGGIAFATLHALAMCAYVTRAVLALRGGLRCVVRGAEHEFHA